MAIEVPINEQEVSVLIARAREAAKQFWYGEEFNCYWALADYYKRMNQGTRVTEMQWEYQLVSDTHENPGKESSEYFKKRFNEAENLYLKARCGVHIWNLIHDNSVATETQKILQGLIRVNSQTGWYASYDHPRFLKRFIENLLLMASQRKDQTTLAWAFEAILGILNDLKKEKSEIKSLNIVEACVPYIGRVDKKLVLPILQKLHFAVKRYAHPSQGYSRRHFLTVEKAIEVALKDQKSAQDTQWKILQSHIDEADDKISRNESFAASFFYGDALKVCSEMQISNKPKLVQELIKKYQAATNGIQWKEARFEMTIRRKDLEPLVKKLRQLPPKEILLALGFSKKLEVKIENARQMAEDLAKKFPLSSRIVPKRLLKGDRLVGRVETDLASITHGAREQLYLQLQFLGAFLDTIFDELVSKKKISPQDFAQLVRESEILDSDRMPIIQSALEHILIRKDYVSGTSVLMPQIEHYLRCLIKAAGMVTTKVEDGGTLKEVSIGSLIRNPIVPKLFGIDFQVSLDILLNDEVYGGMRHGLAHGLLGIRDFTSVRAFILVYVLLKLMLWKRDSSSKRSSAQPGQKATLKEIPVLGTP